MGSQLADQSCYPFSLSLVEGIGLLFGAISELDASRLTSIIAGMAAGADSIDDLDIIRAGRMKRLFGRPEAALPAGDHRPLTHSDSLAQSRKPVPTRPGNAACWPGACANGQARPLPTTAAVARSNHTAAVVPAAGNETS